MLSVFPISLSIAWSANVWDIMELLLTSTDLPLTVICSDLFVTSTATEDLVDELGNWCMGLVPFFQRNILEGTRWLVLLVFAVSESILMDSFWAFLSFAAWEVPIFCDQDWPSSHVLHTEFNGSDVGRKVKVLGYAWLTLLTFPYRYLDYLV